MLQYVLICTKFKALKCLITIFEKRAKWIVSDHGAPLKKQKDFFFWDFLQIRKKVASTEYRLRTFGLGITDLHVHENWDCVIPVNVLILCLRHVFQATRYATMCLAIYMQYLTMIAFTANCIFVLYCNQYIRKAKIQHKKCTKQICT